VTAAYDVPARLEISKAVSATERLGWPPAWGNWGAESGQTKKRNGAADLEICQGSINGRAKSGRVWRRSLARGSQSWPVLATGWGNGVKQWEHAGPRSLVSQGKDATWSVRPVAEVHTRRARATRPSIVTGATGRGSATGGLSTEGQAGIGRGLSAAVSRSRASDKGEAQRSKTVALRTRGDQPVFGNLKRGTERNGSDGRWSGSMIHAEITTEKHTMRDIQSVFAQKQELSEINCKNSLTPRPEFDIFPCTKTRLNRSLIRRRDAASGLVL
jgi:hypothetical protein